LEISFIRTTSVIERVSIDAPIYLQSERDWASIQGKDLPERRPVRYFVNKETGVEYLYILGTFALPGVNKPGYAIVMGNDREPHYQHGKRIIRILEEAESPTVGGLMIKCIKLQAKYGGPAAYPVMSRIWYADLDEIQSDLAMKGIRDAGKELYDICPASGPFFEKKHPWKGYFEVLRDNAKIVDRRDSEKLRAYVAEGPQNLREVMAFKPENNPALAALAIGVAVLTNSKPWFWEVEGSAFNLED